MHIGTVYRICIELGGKREFLLILVRDQRALVSLLASPLKDVQDEEKEKEK